MFSFLRFKFEELEHCLEFVHVGILFGGDFEFGEVLEVGGVFEDDDGVEGELEAVEGLVDGLAGGPLGDEGGEGEVLVGDGDGVGGEENVVGVVEVLLVLVGEGGEVVELLAVEGVVEEG